MTLLKRRLGCYIFQIKCAASGRIDSEFNFDRSARQKLLRNFAVYFNGAAVNLQTSDEKQMLS